MKCAQSASVSTRRLQALFIVVFSRQKKSVYKWIELNLSSTEKREARVIISQIVKVNVSSVTSPTPQPPPSFPCPGRVC